MAGNPGIDRLKQTHIDLIHQHGAAPPTWLAFGTIQDDLGLLIDQFPDVYPLGSYIVLEQAIVTDTTVPTVPPFLATESAGTPAHTHAIAPFAEYLPFAAGDKVLVAILHDATHPVVLGRARPSRLVVP